MTNSLVFKTTSTSGPVPVLSMVGRAHSAFLAIQGMIATLKNVFRVFMDLVGKVVLDDGAVHLLRGFRCGQAACHMPDTGILRNEPSPGQQDVNIGHWYFSL